ncbi:type II secretion system F family protein [Acidithiobacillus montserratensis]|uniref:Type II secretion system F family protein n=1 Tax=Acidithiobacillus montserratensis TaxID=2729135 RepID=A0ACD5HJX6_9PROT|nr:type II secretion system F family protein [Acidithiobacillus montserratensis]
MMLVLILIVLAIFLIGAAVSIALIQQKPSELPGALRERLRAFDQKDSRTEDNPDEKSLLEKSAAGKKDGWLLQWQEKLRQAGMVPRTWLIKSLVIGLFLSLLIGLFLRPWMAPIFFFVIYPPALLAYVQSRIRKRAALALMDLPNFLDAVVRTSRVGASLPAAMLAATKDAQGPIREVFNQVMRRQQSGMPLDRALLVVAKRYQMQELAIVATVLRLNIRYGGRVDIILERIADWLRGRVSAQAELSALSAETRFGALIMSLLIPALAIYIMIMNSKYLLGMWDDATGRLVLIFGAILLLTGVVLVNRMAKLR